MKKYYFIARKRELSLKALSNSVKLSLIFVIIGTFLCFAHLIAGLVVIGVGIILSFSIVYGYYGYIIKSSADSLFDKSEHVLEFKFYNDKLKVFTLEKENGNVIDDEEEIFNYSSFLKVEEIDNLVYFYILNKEDRDCHILDSRNMTKGSVQDLLQFVKDKEAIVVKGKRNNARKFIKNTHKEVCTWIQKKFYLQM